MLGRIGATEIIIILVILLLLFGGKKLPELARGLGDALKELRKGVEGEKTPTSGGTNSDGTNSGGNSNDQGGPINQ